MLTIYTDGAARGNPGPGGWGAIIASDEHVVEIGGREDHTTNNRMELSAVIEALKKAVDDKEITVYTDSAYVLNGITRWVKGWARNNWKTSLKEDVVNKDLWQELISASEHKIINWKLIKGHSGTPGNERCDVIATSFADKSAIVLYEGSRGRYGVDLSFSLNPTEKSGSKRKAYSYVSFVNGEIKIHKTWEECKARVNGVKGAKYKKTISPENEEEVVKELSSNT
jgi:ribonuclease HI